MNLHETFFGVMPAVSIIYKILGFIPANDEISQDQYAAYESEGGDISKQLYTIIPKDGKVFMPNDEIGVLTEVDVSRLMRAAEILREYAKDDGCDSDNSDDILACRNATSGGFYKGHKI